VTATAQPGDGVRRLPRARRLGLRPAARAVILRELERLEGGELHLALPDGSARRFGDPSAGWSVRATIRTDDLFRRMAMRGRTGLGEGYVAGDWETDDLPAVLELLIRNLEPAASRQPWSALARLGQYRPRLPRANGLRRARRHIHYHYDLGNDLFALFLDESLTYSCAYFERPGQSLAAAQQAKYRRLCEKLAIGPDDNVLEIGCGWGGFALHAARERGARVTGLTISDEQHALAQSRVREAGLEDRVDILALDYRLMNGSFSKIVSIEMIEAIGERQFQTFFASCDRLLARGGLVGIQTIAVPDQIFPRYRRSGDWIREYVFPGSLIPSLTALTYAMTSASRLMVHGLEEIGIHYADTLGQWRARFLEQLDAVRSLGYDQRFIRTWDFYLASCEALFRTRCLRDLQLVLTRPFNRSLPPHPSARITF
jgi:cyclopropane-fatty-acyl-phospholipid synthase